MTEEERLDQLQAQREAGIAADNSSEQNARLIQDATSNEAPVAPSEPSVPAERDIKAEMLANIDAYRKKLDTPEKKDWTDSLPDILAGAHNILNYSQGSQQKMMDMNHASKASAGRAANRQADLGGLQNLQKLYQNHQAKQGKGKSTQADKDNRAFKESENQKEREYRSAEKEKDRKAKQTIKKIEKENKVAPKTKLQEEREKDIANRFTTLEEQIPNRMANIEEAQFLIKELEADRLSTGPGSELAGNIGSFFDTEESTLKQKLDSLAEKAARAQLKANGEVRPTDADVEGMKRAMFNLGNTEKANVDKLKSFIKQQESGLDEYNQMKSKVDKGEGLEDFKLKPTYKSEGVPAPQGKMEVKRNGKNYRWNSAKGKYQLYRN